MTFQARNDKGLPELGHGNKDEQKTNLRNKQEEKPTEPGYFMGVGGQGGLWADAQIMAWTQNVGNTNTSWIQYVQEV